MRESFANQSLQERKVLMWLLVVLLLGPLSTQPGHLVNNLQTNTRPVVFHLALADLSLRYRWWGMILVSMNKRENATVKVKNSWLKTQIFVLVRVSTKNLGKTAYNVCEILNSVRRISNFFLALPSNNNA